MQDDPVKTLIEQIYESKCMELKIDNQEILRNRFVATIFAEIPKGVLNLSNQSLRASTMTFVKQLIEQLGACVHTLILDNNPIQDEGVEIVLQSINTLRNYHTISLMSVGLNPEGIISFLSSFINTPVRLQTLNLGSNPSAEKRNRFNEECCKYIGKFVSECKSMETIDFSNSQIRSMNGYLIFKNVNQETRLKNIILANTGINNQAIIQLCSVNAKYFPYIQYLDISGNNTITEESCQYIAQFINKKRYFHKLSIANCTELNNGVMRIFESLQYHSADKLAASEEQQKRNDERAQRRTEHLMGLGIGVQNMLTHGKVVLKGDILPIPPVVKEDQEENQLTTAIKSIDLTNIKLNSKQFESLAKAVESNESLEEIILESIGIDFNKPEYIPAFASFCQNISQSKTIKYLNISRNVIYEKEDIKSTLLQESLPKLLNISSLETLNLSYNRTNDQVFIKFAQNIPNCQNLKKLFIQGNNCGEDGAQAILLALQRYTKLQVLDINLNKINFQLTEKLAAIIKQNIDQSCTDIYTQFQQEHNKLSDDVSKLQETEFNLQQHYAKQQDLYGQIQKKSADLLLMNEDYEQKLDAERVTNDQLNRKQTILDGEVQKINARNQEIQQKIDNEHAIFESKKKMVRDKQNNAQQEIERLQGEIDQLKQDPELLQLQKELENKKQEKLRFENEAVAVLAQLAAIEAVLIKEGVLTIQEQPAKKK